LVLLLNLCCQNKATQIEVGQQGLAAVLQIGQRGIAKKWKKSQWHDSSQGKTLSLNCAGASPSCQGSETIAQKRRAADHLRTPVLSCATVNKHVFLIAVPVQVTEHQQLGNIEE
jgi:hypothetical protein